MLNKNKLTHKENGEPRVGKYPLLILIGLSLTVAGVVYYTGWTESKKEVEPPEVVEEEVKAPKDIDVEDILVEDDLVEDDTSKEVTIIKETKTISVTLNMYSKPDKHEVEIVLKNTATEETAYNFSTPNIYRYKILNESNKVIKEGTFGNQETGTITLLKNEEHKTTFNYDATYKELPKGFYNLEVTINSEELRGSKSSTTFTKNDFDTSVTAVRTETLVIRSVDYEKNTLEGVVNGVALITLKFSDTLEQEIKKYKIGRDVLHVTYLGDKGVYTLQALSMSNEPTKVPEKVEEPTKPDVDTTTKKKATDKQ